jgi:hypothetical protein
LKQKQIIDAAKEYWLKYFPLEEMPRIPSIIAEGYRKHLLTDNQALSAMDIAEGIIKDWVKENNSLYKKINKKVDKKTKKI